MVKFAVFSSAERNDRNTAGYWNSRDAVSNGKAPQSPHRGLHMEALNDDYIRFIKRGFK